MNRAMSVCLLFGCVCVCVPIVCEEGNEVLISVRSRQMSVPQTPARMVLLVLTSSTYLSEYKIHHMV